MSVPAFARVFTMKTFTLRVLGGSKARREVKVIKEIQEGKQTETEIRHINIR